MSGQYLGKFRSDPDKRPDGSPLRHRDFYHRLPGIGTTETWRCYDKWALSDWRDATESDGFAQPTATGPGAAMNLSERLERMARAADEGSEVYRKHQTTLATDLEKLPYALLILALLDVARILRAGVDPNEPLSEEHLRNG